MNLEANMELPRLEPGKCSMIFAERATGILLTLQGTRYLNDKGEFLRVFESQGDAEAFATTYVQSNPAVECVIFDCDGQYLKTVERP